MQPSRVRISRNRLETQKDPETGLVCLLENSMTFLGLMEEEDIGEDEEGETKFIYTCDRESLPVIVRR